MFNYIRTNKKVYGEGTIYRVEFFDGEFYTYMALKSRKTQAEEKKLAKRVKGMGLTKYYSLTRNPGQTWEEFFEANKA